MRTLSELALDASQLISAGEWGPAEEAKVARLLLPFLRAAQVTPKEPITIFINGSGTFVSVDGIPPGYDYVIKDEAP